MTLKQHKNFEISDDESDGDMEIVSIVTGNEKSAEIPTDKSVTAYEDHARQYTMPDGTSLTGEENGQKMNQANDQAFVMETKDMRTSSCEYVTRSAVKRQNKLQERVHVVLKRRKQLDVDGCKMYT